jgi:hypothetical protein
VGEYLGLTLPTGAGPGGGAGPVDRNLLGQAGYDPVIVWGAFPASWYQPAYGLNIQPYNYYCEFATGVRDARAHQVVIPSYLDLGVPLRYRVPWFPTQDGAGQNARFYLRTCSLREGDTIDGTATETSVLTDHAPGTQDVIVVQEWEIDVSALAIGDIFCLMLERDGTDLADDFAGSIKTLPAELIGRCWR